MKFFAGILLCASCLCAQNLKTDEVKVMGALDYGETSEELEYTGTPQYAALIFNGTGKDKVEVAIKGGDRKAWIAIADGALKELANGTGQLTFTLPDNGPDIEAYYIVFRDPDGKPAKFTVTLKKIAKASAAGAATGRDSSGS